MDEFPVNLTRDKCISQMTENQKNLLKTTRKLFTEIIDKSVDNCDKEVILNFPDRLWMDNRIIIATELQDRFGEIKLINPQKHATITKITNQSSELPKNIQSITIEFFPKLNSSQN